MPQTMPQTFVLKFGRTEAGYRLRIEGRGTMLESRPAQTFVGEALASPDALVVIDLSACDYLDSTFLGCLLGLHRQFGAARLRIAAPPERTRKLFGPTKLDVVLQISAELPALIGDYAPLPPELINSKEMARHIMECHHRLAEIPGPQQAAFAAIAEQMARELEKRA
jgi:anti-anti-sigma regulatory factor